MVKFALTDFDFDDCARLDAGLPGLSALALPADLSGLAADLFLSVRAGLGASRPAGLCAKAPREKMRMERIEETKKIEKQRLRIADCGVRIEKHLAR
jgi:hypothetical protein